MIHIDSYLNETKEIANKLNKGQIKKVIDLLYFVRESGGRLFLLGTGGGAGHASHAVNDFRKICGIESYTPTDNVSELTARVNDEGWDTCYVNWLKISKLRNNDMLCVFSVGGGDIAKRVSVNIIKSLEYAKEVGAKICGVVGRNGGYTAQVADACVIIPTVNEKAITPHTESFQAVILHLMVSHPKLQKFGMKWESIK